MKILLFLFIVTMISCNGDEPQYFEYFDYDPKVDGKSEKVWTQVNPNQLYFYYGQEAEDSLDFKSYCKVLQNKDDIYIFVIVYDQIKYTHPKPKDIYDLKLWNPADYDRVNLSFDADNDGKDDFRVSMNYGLDTVFTNNILQKRIEAALCETSNGYNVELKIPLELFTTSIIKFNVIVTDNDRRFDKEGLDVFSLFESKYGRGFIYKKR